jgi:putative ABC transport system substrate-binding protein
VAAELIRRKVDVLVASGVPSVLPAKRATSTIPVVFVAALDPVATGVVASLGWPGGNVTGVAVMHSALTAKRLELVKELLPNVSRVAILVRATSPAATEYTQQAEAAARSLGIALQVLTARDPLELEGTLITARGASALIQSDDAVFTAHRTEIANSALKNRLPLVSGLREVVEAAVLSPTERIRGNSTGTLPPTSTRS